MGKKRYCIVGASSRGRAMYAHQMVKAPYNEYCEIVGIYDTNPGRAQALSSACGNFPVYATFYQMIKEAKPDAVIITTMDKFHEEYAVKAMEMGCDAIVEKPMCITLDQARRILDAKERTGRHVTTTFNMRYMPYKLKVKELLMSGIIGEIENVTFEWNLIYAGHGTSYFRRWHALMENSGGLLLTKAAHHFDIANWFVDSYPAKITAFGKLDRYGKNGSFRDIIGGDTPAEHCHECPHKDTCKLYVDTTKGQLYFPHMQYDGYTDDCCVFRKDVDIYDSASVNVLYENGVTMAYTLNANAPYEGWRIAFNGTKGRLEAGEIMTGAEDLVTFGRDVVRVMNYKEGTKEFPVEAFNDAHGGGDQRLLLDLLNPTGDDPYYQRATAVDGAASVLIGALANESIAQGGKVIDVTERLGRELRSYL
ncbi:MAG: Gfo/Idh/MocA family oxidoreductase [Clostridia bacterium]|nr:Gfo/Idh/MocA family oxidoreductase [Clostridia bacterium]